MELQLISKFEYREDKVGLVLGLIGIWTMSGFMVFGPPSILIKFIFVVIPVLVTYFVIKKIRGNVFEIKVWEDRLLLPCGGIKQWNNESVEIYFNGIRELKIMKNFKYGPKMIIITDHQSIELSPRKLKITDIENLYDIIAAKRGFPLFDFAVSEEMKSLL